MPILKNIDVIAADNWRMFTKKLESNWKDFRDDEFGDLIKKVCKIAKENNFSVWTGRTKNPYSFNISGWISKEKALALSIRMEPKNSYKYMAAETREWNPQNVNKAEYTKEIGSTVNEVEEYVSSKLFEFVSKNGKPTEKAHYFTGKSISTDKKVEIVLDAIKSMDWNEVLY